MILPQELKEEHWYKRWTSKALGLFSPSTTKKYAVSGIKPVGAPTYDPREGRMTGEEQNPVAWELLLRAHSEVIEPRPEDTAEVLASLISQAACDHEYRRVIVYPVPNSIRQATLELVANDPVMYPMYEYLPANICGNDDLNSQTIIYKYGGQSHFTKPV